MIRVLESGLYTSIQDKGRFGYRNIGVPVAGFMDEISAGLANKLLNNTENAALLEITLKGPKLLFLNKTYMVITGAHFDVFLNNSKVENNKVVQVNSQDILSFGKLNNGFRAYLSVLGGFKSENILGSTSFYKGITYKEKLEKEDYIQYNSKTVVSAKKAGKGLLKIDNPFFNCKIIDVYQGVEFELFPEKDQEKLLNVEFTISHQMNRMGIQLNEKRINHNFSIITSPVLPGTVQCTSNGKLIVLMKDAQTTGGYPRVFQLTKKAMAIIAQKQPNERIIFNLVK